MTEVAWIVMGVWSATKVLGLIIDIMTDKAWVKLEKAHDRNNYLRAEIEKLEQQIEELKK